MGGGTEFSDGAVSLVCTHSDSTFCFDSQSGLGQIRHATEGALSEAPGIRAGHLSYFPPFEQILRRSSKRPPDQFDTIHN
jgi:hypothetical protein